MTTLTLTSADVEALADADGMRAAMAAAHRALHSRSAVQPTPHPLPASADRAADAPTVVPMAAISDELGIFAIKVLADAPRNRSLGLPAQRSTVALFDAATAECVALIDGRALTRLRTAAVTALATDLLAPPSSDVVALIGAGPLAAEHGRALMRVRPFTEMRIWSRSGPRAEACAEQLRSGGIPAIATESRGDALDGAGVVCTLTPAQEPFLARRMLGEDVLVNAIGSPPRPGFSEVCADVFAQAHAVVVDDIAVALAESGNVRGACEAGALDPARLQPLGNVVAASDGGRGGLTVFNSVGLGVQDLYAARLLCERARAVGAGTMVAIRS
ncbi:ornithine cyclodeaminase family protein [Microbacterium dextranolyticum]|uniref:Ornithine cyclodeaminase n=1 Tax=Microbacterium dextranolyticum TaxID=36806 RepID=A0A9W6M5P8_9MICO|nr:ornithine cyclodeaminase family protein [Microbacterium dextranolyticum]MBM7463961.1 ornithine cyclodeaminase/alanine dehydrogenase [Microbacterium dextranolyticum]GLJ95041.1 ornithine cyclodeaminase [Microbacterium dextranolyticum]